MAVTTETSPMTSASRQRTAPARVCRHEPRTATGMIASSEVASASSWPRPSTSGEGRDEDDPPAHPEQAGDDAGGDPEGR